MIVFGVKDNVSDSEHLWDDVCMCARVCVYIYVCMCVRVFECQEYHCKGLPHWFEDGFATINKRYKKF